MRAVGINYWVISGGGISIGISAPASRVFTRAIAVEVFRIRNIHRAARCGEGFAHPVTLLVAAVGAHIERTNGVGGQV